MRSKDINSDVKRFYSMKAKNRRISVRWFTDEQGNEMLWVKTKRLVSRENREIKAISEMFSYESFQLLLEAMLAVSNDPIFLQETEELSKTLMESNPTGVTNCKLFSYLKVPYDEKNSRKTSK